MSPQCLPQSFSLSWLTVREQITFQDFQAGHHGGHLGSGNGTNLAILNLHVTPIPPAKFGLNPTYHSQAVVVWWFRRWPQWRTCWILEQDDFLNSESLCCSDASHQVSAQSDLQFGRCHLTVFKMAGMLTILDIRKEWFYQFYLTMWPKSLPPSLGSIWLRVPEQMWFQDFQDGHQGGHLG